MGLMVRDALRAARDVIILWEMRAFAAPGIKRALLRHDRFRIHFQLSGMVSRWISFILVAV
jgi:hypothetical protein